MKMSEITHECKTIAPLCAKRDRLFFATDSIRLHRCVFAIRLIQNDFSTHQCQRNELQTLLKQF